jgi:hypothetical protein
MTDQLETCKVMSWHWLFDTFNGLMFKGRDVFEGFIFFTEANCYGKITKK